MTDNDQLSFCFCVRCGAYLNPSQGVVEPDGIICDACEKVEMVNRIRQKIGDYLSGRGKGKANNRRGYHGQDKGEFFDCRAT